MLVLFFMIFLNVGIYFQFFLYKKMMTTLMMNMENNYFFFVILCVVLSVFYYLKYYMKKEKIFSLFMILLIIFILSMILLITTESFLFMYAGWEGLGVSSFLLIFHYKNWKSMNNSLITMMTNKMGDFTFILMLSYLLFNNNMMNKQMIGYLLILTIMTKSAIFPFMSWLPAAMSAPTPISSLVHSSTLVTAGLMLLKKFNEMTPLYQNNFLTSFCLMGMIVSSVLAMVESDFKKIVAFSTMSQISFMMFTYNMNMMYLCFMHLFMHAFMKSLLFFCVGIIIHENEGNQKVNMYNKVYKNSNTNTLLMISMLLNMSGLLFMSCFFSKEVIIEFLMSKDMSISLNIFIFTVALTFIYSVNLIMNLTSMVYLPTIKMNNNMNTTFLFSWYFTINMICGIFMMKNFPLWYHCFNYNENKILMLMLLMLMMTYMFIEKWYSILFKYINMLSSNTKNFVKGKMKMIVLDYMMLNMMSNFIGFLNKNKKYKILLLEELSATILLMIIII